MMSSNVANELGPEPKTLFDIQGLFYAPNAFKLSATQIQQALCAVNELYDTKMATAKSMQVDFDKVVKSTQCDVNHLISLRY